jgi:small subunit ribosomal protein S13e
MGRMHSKGKGISKSSLPYKRNPPSWLKISAQEVCDQICKLAKKGMVPSQIGVYLRDSQGVTQVGAVTGNKILRILKANGLSPELPEGMLIIDETASMSAMRRRERK